MASDKSSDFLIAYGREPFTLTKVWPVLPQDPAIADYIQLSAAAGLILYTLLGPIFRVKPLRPQKRWRLDNVLCWLIHIAIAIYCTFRISSQLASPRNTSGLDRMPLAVYTVSTVAAGFNILGPILGQTSTARGTYHLISTLNLAWHISTSRPSVAVTDLILPPAFALAFLLDVFNSALPSELPPAMSGLSLSEHFCYSWLTRVVRSPAPLNINELPEIRLLQDFDGYLGRLRDATTHPSSALVNIFWRFIIREHTHQLVKSSCLRLVDDASKFALPWLLSSLLTRPTPWNVALMFCSRIVGACCGNYSGYYLKDISSQYKAVLSAALHAKTLQLGDSKAPAQAANLATLGEVDAQILYRAAQQFSDIWALPFHVVLCLGGLAYLLPFQALLTTIAVIAIVIPITGIFIKSIAYWVTRNMSAKDHRTKLIIEALEVIQSIKMHAWESTFVELIDDRRTSELKTVQSTAVSTSGLVCCMQGLPSVLVLASFGSMIYLNQELNSDIVFASLLLFTMLNNSLVQISGLASTFQATIASSTRIQTYLNLSEEKLSAFGFQQLDYIQSRFPMRLDCSQLGWPASPHLLESGSLHINRGTLTVIAGGMGSGKSTVLLAILRYLEKRSFYSDNIDIGYVPQQPLLVNGSVRDNILFGRPYDAQWYAQVIHACCLDVDFDHLQHGDSTVIIGSSTLSGGQGARVSLARAAYRRTEVYLFDDPTAAIDIKVSAEIIRRLLGPDGILAASTRIICTTDMAIIQHADWVHELMDGSVRVRQGQRQVLDSILDMSLQDTSTSQGNVDEEIQKKTPIVSVMVSESPEPHSRPDDYDQTIHVSSDGRSPILTYLLSAKRSSWLIATCVLLLARASSVISTYVLKIMVTDLSASLLAWDLAVFGLFSASQIALFFCFVLLLYNMCIIPASSKLHRDLTAAIFSQGISFFQTTQIGDILNLFTNDISRIDGSLNSSIASLMGQYANLTLSCGVLVLSSPLSIGFVIPLLVAAYQLQLVYLTKLRELRRLDASSRAPLLEHLQEADKGRVAFSTYKVTDSRLVSFNQHLANNLRAMFPLSCLDLWLGLRLEVASVVLQVGALGFLLGKGVDSGTLGFVMTYLFQVTTTLSFIAKISAQTEADAVSVARIEDYSRMTGKGEVSLDNNTGSPYSDTGPEATWPRHGKLEFKSVSARHRPGLPNCLDSITLTIKPGERVAVVGRTGAGKSSLVLSILRMIDQTAGQILIDDIDIARVSLPRLRRCLALMPQAQVMLSSSVRKNLDPLGRHTDEHILQCLGAWGLLSTINKLVSAEDATDSKPGSLLDIKIEDRSRFSKGEMQMISLARAMLQQSSVVVLDEATSGMDASAETFVHDLIFSKLRNTTLLAIMHRLNLTIYYDKVLILDHGRVAAFDSPAALLADDDGLYFSMIAEDPELLKHAQEYFRN